MVQDLWNMQPGVDLKIPVDIDANTEFVGPNGNTMIFSLIVGSSAKIYSSGIVGRFQIVRKMRLGSLYW